MVIFQNGTLIIIRKFYLLKGLMYMGFAMNKRVMEKSCLIVEGLAKHEVLKWRRDVARKDSSL